jgi:hypothetical protein
MGPVFKYMGTFFKYMGPCTAAVDTHRHAHLRPLSCVSASTWFVCPLPFSAPRCSWQQAHKTAKTFLTFRRARMQTTIGPPPIECSRTQKFRRISSSASRLSGVSAYCLTRGSDTPVRAQNHVLRQAHERGTTGCQRTEKEEVGDVPQQQERGGGGVEFSVP